MPHIHPPFNIANALSTLHHHVPLLLYIYIYTYNDNNITYLYLNSNMKKFTLCYYIYLMSYDYYCCCCVLLARRKLYDTLLYDIVNTCVCLFECGTHSYIVGIIYT